MLKLHRFARFRDVRASAYAFATVIVGLALFLWNTAQSADFVMSKWPVRPMPFELVIVFGGLAWLVGIAFWPELDKAEQPDVALVWGLNEHDRGLMDQSQCGEHFIAENRSGEFIYNVQIHSIALKSEMEFEQINEIEANGEFIPIVRWDGHSSIDSKLEWFFIDDGNVAAAQSRKWRHEKTHLRGLSPSYLKIPVLVTYETTKRAWRVDWWFIYDPGGGSHFIRKSARRI